MDHRWSFSRAGLNTPLGAGAVSKYLYKVPKALKEAFTH